MRTKPTKFAEVCSISYLNNYLFVKFSDAF